MTEPVCQEERRGVYPGSFDPPTIAHLAIAVMARRSCGLDRVDLAVSRSALAKEDADHAPFETRLAVIEASIAHAPWLHLVVTDARLIADIADGYEVVIMGGDKWAQVNDPIFYDNDPAARDAAVARLPQIAAVNRAGSPPLPDGVTTLDLPAKLQGVSSSGAREGRADWMTPPARKQAERDSIWGL